MSNSNELRIFILTCSFILVSGFLIVFLIEVFNFFRKFYKKIEQMQDDIAYILRQEHRNYYPHGPFSKGGIVPDKPWPRTEKSNISPPPPVNEEKAFKYIGSILYRNHCSKDCPIDPDKLENLAYWFDRYDEKYPHFIDPSKSNEVQRDLRNWAKYVRNNKKS